MIVLLSCLVVSHTYKRKQLADTLPMSLIWLRQGHAPQRKQSVPRRPSESETPRLRRTCPKSLREQCRREHCFPITTKNENYKQWDPGPRVACCALRLSTSLPHPSTCLSSLFIAPEVRHVILIGHDNVLLDCVCRAVAHALHAVSV